MMDLLNSACVLAFMAFSVPTVLSMKIYKTENGGNIINRQSLLSLSLFFCDRDTIPGRAQYCSGDSCW